MLGVLEQINFLPFFGDPIFWGATYVGQNKRNLLEIWLLLDGILVGSNYELLKFGS